MDSTWTKQTYDDLSSVPLQSERIKRVTFQPKSHRSTTMELLSSLQAQPSQGVEPPSPTTMLQSGREDLQRHDRYRIRNREKDSDGDKVQISKDFMSQLCQAFKVQNLAQLQKLLPYQPIAPEPLPSREKQQTYYENNLIYNAATSGESASDYSDDEGSVAQRASTTSQQAPQRNMTNPGARALLNYRERPLRGKWIPPSHIPQLDESIKDYDIWF